MKKIFLFIYFLMGFIYLQAQDTVLPPQKNIDEIVRFTNADYDMGKIPAGKPLEYTVTLTNISKDTISVQNVIAGCGCTTPKYRAGEKMLPGKSAIVVLGFNGDAHGAFIKTADIIFTNGLVKQVRFRGTAIGETNPPANTAVN